MTAGNIVKQIMRECGISQARLGMSRSAWYRAKKRTA